MTHRYRGSRVAVGMCALAVGIVLVGIAGKNVMTACDVIETPDPATGEVQTTYVFERDECRDSERKRGLRTRAWGFGLAGTVTLLTSAGALATARTGARRRE